MSETLEWWKDKVAEDIYDTMRKKEEYDLPVYYGRSTQLWARRQLVDWISVIVENFNLERTSHHLAVYLMDFFMEKLEVDRNHLYLLAMACLCIAVKYEEHCEKRPRLSSLNAFIPSHGLLDIHSYTASDLRSMELSVLGYFNWSLSIPTCAQFLPYFLNVAIDKSDLRNGIPISNKQVVESYIKKHIHYFQEISLQDHSFRNYLPSLVAACCVAASRTCLQLTPIWPKWLELMSGYCIEELLPCVHTMLRLQQQDKQQQASSEVHVVPTHPAFLPVVHNRQQSVNEVHVVPSYPAYFPVIQTPSLYKPHYPEYGAFHDDFTKSTMYAPSKSQVLSVGRES